MDFCLVCSAGVEGRIEAVTSLQLLLVVLLVKLTKLLFLVVLFQ